MNAITLHPNNPPQFQIQKTMPIIIDAFIDKFFPFADLLRGDDFKFAKQCSKTILTFLTKELQEALYETIVLFLISTNKIYKNKYK